jgi:hypothetical protein
MMQLPATYVEAEALAFTYDFLRALQQGNFIGLGNAPLDADHALARRMYRLLIGVSPSATAQVIEKATVRGELAAHEALIEAIDEKTERNEPLGLELGFYNKHERKIPFRAHSGPARSSIIEETIIGVLIIELVDRFGLIPVGAREPKHKRPSACSIVSRVMIDLGLRGGGDEAIRKVWKRVARHILPGYRLG